MKWDRTRRDMLHAAVFTLMLFVLFHYLDVFEWIYDLTRTHEDWEADEFVMLLLALPVPLAWYSWRRSRDSAVEAQKRLALERAMAHSSKLESLGTLAGGVAHEINNQLTPVLSMTEMLLKNLPGTAGERRKIELIHKGASRARDTVMQIKRFSTLRASEAGVSNVVQTVLYTRELVSHFTPASIQVDFSLHDLYGEARIDSADLEAVIINLFSNAIDAIGRGRAGRISMDASTRELNEQEADRLGPGLYAIFRISDSGEGVPRDLQKRIFEPFFTTKKTGEGMGLGLSIIYATIQRAGGDVRLESEPGSGSCFTVYLPVQSRLTDQSRTHEET